MRVEQFVVIEKIVAGGIRRDRVPGDVVGIRREVATRIENRHGVVRNVYQELMTGAHRVREVDRGRQISLDEFRSVVCISKYPIGAGSLHHDLREAVQGTWNEIAIEV